ncbi:hypothetical protein [Actinomycetospora chiangmaiensis]|uniref:hypothetical protein n=1 Tax=Actinomycetospora chiangmaiensis TaxID=402650 RepID=UPI000382EF45|nr:hypothetical protein [Actinomycetospora chiangmaiensis]
MRRPVDPAPATVRILPGTETTGGTCSVEIDDPILEMLVRVTLDTTAAPVEVMSLTLLPRVGGRPLRSVVRPDLRPDLYVALALATVADEHDRHEASPPETAPAAVSLPRRPGAVNAARHRPDDLDAPIDLARVAAVYRAARVSADRQERRAPVAAVARDLGVHRTDAARFVREARAVGLLEAAPPGDRYRG